MTNCARRSHWIAGRVGSTCPGYGHDGGFTGTRCITYAEASDCDPLSLCTVIEPVESSQEITPQ